MVRGGVGVGGGCFRGGPKDRVEGMISVDILHSYNYVYN